MLETPVPWPSLSRGAAALGTKSCQAMIFPQGPLPPTSDGWLLYAPVSTTTTVSPAPVRLGKSAAAWSWWIICAFQFQLRSWRDSRDSNNIGWRFRRRALVMKLRLATRLQIAPTQRLETRAFVNIARLLRHAN